MFMSNLILEARAEASQQDADAASAVPEQQAGRLGQPSRSALETFRFQRLDLVVIGLAVAERFQGDVLHHGFLEVVLVDLGDRQALLLEDLDQFLLLRLDLGRGAGGGLLSDRGEDLLVLVRELGPELLGDDRVAGGRRCGR